MLQDAKKEWRRDASHVSPTVPMCKTVNPSFLFSPSLLSHFRENCFLPPPHQTHLEDVLDVGHDAQVVPDQLAEVEEVGVGLLGVHGLHPFLCARQPLDGARHSGVALGARQGRQGARQVGGVRRQVAPLLPQVAAGVVQALQVALHLLQQGRLVLEPAWAGRRETDLNSLEKVKNKVF